MSLNSDFMNPPEEPKNQAYASYTFGENGMKMYAACPYCGKKQFLIRKETVIKNLPWKCKASNCKKDFEVNIY